MALFKCWGFSSIASKFLLIFDKLTNNKNIVIHFESLKMCSFTQYFNIFKLRNGILSCSTSSTERNRCIADLNNSRLILITLLIHLHSFFFTSLGLLEINTVKIYMLEANVNVVEP